MHPIITIFRNPSTCSGARQTTSAIMSEPWIYRISLSCSSVLHHSLLKCPIVCRAIVFFLKCKLFVNLIGFYGFRFTTDLLKSNVQKVFGILLWIYNTYIKHKLSQTRFLRCMLTPWYAYWDFLQCPCPLTHCEFSVVSIVRISQGMPCRSRLE